MKYATQSGDPSVHEIPGKALGIWAFVLAFIVPVLGLVFGIVAAGQSRRAGSPNGLALAGIVVSLVLMSAAVITTIAIAVGGGFSPYTST